MKKLKVKDEALSLKPPMKRGKPKFAKLNERAYYERK